MKTIPRVKKTRMDKIPAPVFKTLTGDMGFDPEDQFDGLEWVPWDLEQTYPPTAGELVGTLTGVMTPTLIDELEDTDETGQADDAGGGGRAVQGGPQDGEPLGAGREDLLDQDTGGAPALPED